MKRLALSLALALLAAPIQAQTIVDGSGSEMDATTREFVLKVVLRELKDPSSAQFRSLRKNGRTAICGEVNGRNSFGAYNGFEKFMVYKGMEEQLVVMMPSQFRNLSPSALQTVFDMGGC